MHQPPMLRWTSATDIHDGVIVFVHVPKTGGLTFRNVLKHQFRDGAIDAAAVRDPIEPPYLPADPSEPVALFESSVERILDGFRAHDTTRTRAVMAHAGVDLLPVMRRPVLPVTILREPIERCLSLFAYRRARHGLRATLPEWIDAFRNYEPDNTATRLIAGARWPEEVPAAALQVAKKNLERFSCVGVTERFDDFQLALLHHLRLPAPGYRRTNVSAARPARGDLSPWMLATLERHNALDIALYEAGRELAARFAEPVTDAQRRMYRARLRAFGPREGTKRRIRRTYARLPRPVQSSWRAIRRAKRGT